MRIGVVGINHKQASLQLREKLAKTCHKWFGVNRTQQTRETFILLSTCNRTEIYFTSHNLADTHTNILHVIRQEVDESFDQKMYSFFGEDCFYHLSAVTAGLDSAIIWETEIQGQVKAAYEMSASSSSIPYELHYLFQKCLKNGKLLRRRYQGVRGIPDIEHAVLDIGVKTLENNSTPKVLFVGASAINLKILTHLKNKGMESLTLCNRTDKRAEYHANRQSVQALPWSQFSKWNEFDWVIFGTKSPAPLISAQNCHPQKKQLILDLCVPRNVDPKVAEHPDIILHNIDEVHHLLEGRRQRIEHLAFEAEALLETVVNRQLTSFRKKRKVIPFSGCAIA